MFVSSIIAHLPSRVRGRLMAFHVKGLAFTELGGEMNGQLQIAEPRVFENKYHMFVFCLDEEIPLSSGNLFT
ncbi:hypothetical protein RB195_002119 [Necator americanus]|uniref:Uncharacterized protein n=1 Tax=Necator americanus TaxID=51031 RepID=A0ABR1DHG7_NECAM